MSPVQIGRGESDMADTDTNVADAVAPSDARMDRALRLVDAWCRERRCEPEDIPARARNGLTRENVAMLAYTLRKDVGLDIIPSAELLGVEPAELMALSRDMGVLIERRKDSTLRAKLDALLAASLREAKRANREKALVLPKPGRKSAQERRQRKYAANAALTERRKDVARLACDVMGVTLEKTFDMRVTLRDTVNARSVVFALIYALDQRKNISSIARSLDTNAMNVAAGVRRIDKILRADPHHYGGWQEKIAEVCAAFGIEPVRLLRAQ